MRVAACPPCAGRVRTTLVGRGVLEVEPHARALLVVARDVEGALFSCNLHQQPRAHICAMTALATVRENAPHRLQVGVEPLETLLTAERREHEAEFGAVGIVERDLTGIHHLLEQVEVRVEHERRVVGRVHVEREEETAHVVRHREQVADLADRRRVPRVDCAHAPMDVHPSEDPLRDNNRHGNS